MKKVVLFLLAIFSSFTLILNTFAEETTDNTKEKVNIYMFTKQGCPVCARSETYFSKLASDKEYGPMFNLVTLKVFDDGWNIISQDFYDSLIEVSQKMGDKFNGVPYIIIGDKSLNGFDESYDSDIKETIKRCYEEGYIDPMAVTEEKQDPKDPDKGMKTAINIISTIIIIGIPALIIASRLGSKKTEKGPKSANIKDKKKTETKIDKPKKETTVKKSSKTKTTKKEKVNKKL